MKLTPQELDGILAGAGLLMAEPYSPRNSYAKRGRILTTCKRCGTTAHYSLETIEKGLKHHETVCKACFWKEWYENSEEAQGAAIAALLAASIDPSDVVGPRKQNVTWAEAEHFASSHGYELVNLIDGNGPGCQVYVVRCPGCGRQSAMRDIDVAFGCPCNEAAKAKTRPSPAPFDPAGISAAASKKAQLPNKLETASKNQTINSWIERRIARSHDLRGLMVTDIPELVAAWEDEADPSSIAVDTIYTYHFQCNEGHHPKQTPSSFLVDGCMVCRNLATKNDPNAHYLIETDPELAAEWVRCVGSDAHTPENVKDNSKRLVTWHCLCCGHEWNATVRERQRKESSGCPRCHKIKNSFAWRYPDLAVEWSTDNPVSPWCIMPNSKLDFRPLWACRHDPSHTWRAGIPTRIKGRGNCPECAKVAR